MKNCPKCGTTNQDDYKYCESCACPLEGSDSKSGNLYFKGSLGGARYTGIFSPDEDDIKLHGEHTASSQFKGRIGNKTYDYKGETTDTTSERRTFQFSTGNKSEGKEISGAFVGRIGKVQYVQKQTTVSNSGSVKRSSRGSHKFDNPVSEETTKFPKWLWGAVTGAVTSMVAVVLVLTSLAPSAGNKDVMLEQAIENYIQSEIYTNDELPAMLEYQNAVLEAITYDIQNCNFTKGTMDVKFEYVDVLQLADSVTDPGITEDEYYIFCLEQIISNRCKMATETISVEFEPAAGGYSIITSDALTNVLSGGALNYYLDLLEDINYG